MDEFFAFKVSVFYKSAYAYTCLWKCQKGLFYIFCSVHNFSFPYLSYVIGHGNVFDVFGFG